MKIYNSLDEFKPCPNPVLTIGSFDGVHQGHKKIIEHLTATAKHITGESILMTFSPHPRRILHPEETSFKLINTLEEKTSILGSCGINHLLIIPFSHDFSNLTSSDFINNILVKKLKITVLVIGYDHHFGKNRLGSFQELKECASAHQFGIEQIPECGDKDGIPISSSRIRSFIVQGQIKDANRLLGYPFFIKGQVIKGEQIGRTLGYPTANLSIKDSDKIIPPDGIYAARVHFKEECFGGMLYIGSRPTVNGQKHNIEVHVFHFNQEIYHRELLVEFLDFLRPDIKFDNLNQLKIQLGKDEIQAKKVIKLLA